MERDQALGANYRLIELIGSGAAGEVWRAVDLRSERIVAAKLLRPEHVAEPVLVEHFIRERSLLTGLRAPNVIGVLDLVVEGATLAIVMEYVGGGSVRDLLTATPTLPPLTAASIVAGTLRGLAAAHDQGVLHRDVKPDNVLLSEQWREGEGAARAGVKVADFGIARILAEVPHRPSRSTGIIGTPEYMAPELIARGLSEPAGDVYGAGILLHELLTGRTPFAGPGTDFTVAYRHVNAEVERLAVPEPLADLHQRLLAKDPRARPSAADAAAQLTGMSEVLAGLPALARPDAARHAAPARPGTALRGIGADQKADPESTSTRQNFGPLPDLGAPARGTAHRPIRRAAAPPPIADEPKPVQRPPWWRRPAVVITAASFATVAIIAAVAVPLLTAPDPPPPPPRAAAGLASQQDPSLPTGLTVRREATAEEGADSTQLTIAYTAQNAPLSGPFLEVLPPLDANGSCPTLTWTDGDQEQNVPSVTGLSLQCGWSIDGLEIEPQSTVEVSLDVHQAFTDETQLQEWLDEAASLTGNAIADPDVNSTAYPAQRLQDIDLTAPTRLVSESTVELTMLPVWPSGPDSVNPLLRSPVSGQPSEMLTAIAGGLDGVRFGDGCSGALAVSSDGLAVTALQQASECQVNAQVGNFTNVQSNSFAIVTREGD